VRVGVVCPYSLTLPGGVQGQVLGLGRSLRAMGVDARVMAPCDGPPPDAAVTALGKSMPTADNGSVAPLAPDLACALRTIRSVRDEGFDLLHLHEPLCPGPSLTALLFNETPMVGTYHRAGGSSWYEGLRPLITWLSKRMAVRCAVSEDARDTAAAAMGGQYVVLHNGVEVERFAKAEPTPTDGPTIFFVGRHEPRKGLGVLIDAMADVPSDVVLWVAGDGPETDRLRAKTAGDERVQWLGRLDDAEVASRLCGADVFCAPSLHGESFGVVLLEAMAAQTPIVASDLPGYRNVARAGLDAYLVSPGEPQALAAALRRVLGDRKLADCLVESGQERAAHFSMERLAERYLELYCSALGR